MGVPLLERGKIAVAVRQPRRPTLREAYPDRQNLRKLSDDARLVVSEPIGDLPGAWIEVPEATCAVVAKGDDRLLPFAPKLPPKAR